MAAMGVLEVVVDKETLVAVAAVVVVEVEVAEEEYFLTARIL
jgi:hypothetical protein